MAVRTVRRDTMTAGPAMKSLTYCQANRTRVAVRTVRRDTAGSVMKSLTNCYTNSIKAFYNKITAITDLQWHPA